jgi:hypothetical protein
MKLFIGNLKFSYFYRHNSESCDQAQYSYRQYKETRVDNNQCNINI